MLKPLEDKVIVELPKAEDKVHTSGLIIAGSADEKPNEAIVVAVGPGLTFANGEKMVPDVSVGDKVVFAKYQGAEVSYDDKKYLILSYRDILAVIA